MRFILATILAFGAVLANADNYRVMVGAGGFVFNPTTVMADAGDTIEFVVTGVPICLFSFKLIAKTHGIVSSAFNSPCTSDGRSSYTTSSLIARNVFWNQSDSKLCHQRHQLYSAFLLLSRRWTLSRWNGLRTQSKRNSFYPLSDR